VASAALLKAVIGDPHLRSEGGQSSLPSLAVEFGAPKYGRLHRSHLGTNPLWDR
jgi:hypothetical protein